MMSGLPRPFEAGEIGILIAEVRGDKQHDKQIAYQAAILNAIETTTELREVAKVRLLQRFLPADLEEQHTEAIRLGKLLHATFVLQPNAVAGFEEPWITIIDQPAFTSSLFLSGSFATSQLGQPDELALPRDVVQMARCTLAVLLYRKGSYEAAVEDLEAIFKAPGIPKAAPLQPDLRVMYGNALLGVERIGDAERAYRQAIELDPKNAVAHNNLGWTLGLQGKFDECLSEARKAIELRPNYADAHMTLATALRHKGQLDAAIAEFREAIKFGTDLPYVHMGLGNALSAQHRGDDEALHELEYAIKLDPNYGPAYVNLGVYYGERKHYKEAIATYKKGIDLLRKDRERVLIDDSSEAKSENLTPLLAVAYLDLANDHLALVRAEDGSYNDVIGEFRETIRLAPKLPQAHYGLGNALGLSGSLEEAIGEFREAIKLKPNYDAAYNDLAVALEKSGGFDEALVEHQNAISINPSYENHFSFSVFLFARGRIDEARDETQQALKLKPDSPDGRMKLCQILVFQASNEAVNACRSAVELNPSSPDAHEFLGLAFVRQNQVDNAVTEYKKAIELKPDVAEFHYNLGLELMAVAGGVQQARNEFATANHLNPTIQIPPFAK
jgi:tetratricopeptide (TPR) repeat protein